MWKHWIGYCRTQHVWSSTRTNLLTFEAHLCSQNSTSFQSVNISEFFTGHFWNVILMLVRNMFLGECGVQSCRCLQIQWWGWMWDQVVGTCSQVAPYSRLEEDFAPWDDPCLHLQHHRQQRPWVGTLVPCVFTKVCHVRHFPAVSKCSASFTSCTLLCICCMSHFILGSFGDWCVSGIMVHVSSISWGPSTSSQWMMTRYPPCLPACFFLCLSFMSDTFDQHRTLNPKHMDHLSSPFSHATNFLGGMQRPVNGYNISVCHNFEDDMDVDQVHHWKLEIVTFFLHWYMFQKSLHLIDELLLGFCSTPELQLCNHIQIWPWHLSNALSEHWILLWEGTLIWQSKP